MLHDVEQRLEVSLTVVFVVIHLPPRISQLLCKMAHGAEEQSDLLLVVFYVGGLIADFGHDQPVHLRIENAKACEVVCQLVAENQPEVHKLYISTLFGITNV